jgi:hypothetical protein
MKFTAICKEKNQFTGFIAQLDFSKNDCHILQFYKNEKFISVDIAGISSNYIFYLNPKRNQVKQNKFFIDRYVLQCENSSEILTHFNN